MRHILLPAVTLCWREIVRFVRQRSRVTGAFTQPLVFWVLLGGGLKASFRPPGVPNGMSYVEYFYPGAIALVLLFTAIFSTISVVEDRREGFLQGVLVAPVSRSTIVLGQALGGTALALIQGMLFLLFAPAVGVSLPVLAILSGIGVMFLMAFSLTSLGLVIAARLPRYHEPDSAPHLATVRGIFPRLWCVAVARLGNAGEPPDVRHGRAAPLPLSGLSRWGRRGPCAGAVAPRHRALQHPHLRVRHTGRSAKSDLAERAHDAGDLRAGRAYAIPPAPACLRLVAV